MKCVDAADLAKFLNLPATWEARLLLIEVNALGKPERTLASAVALGREEKVLGVLAGGIRTAGWCLNFLVAENHGFEGHHEKLRALAGVDSSAWGILEHFSLLTNIKTAAQIDQIDVHNSATMESMFRRVQTIEYGWAERIRERESNTQGSSARLSLEEQTVFTGMSRAASNLMICPALLDYVKNEIERDAKFQKPLRTAREEREAQAKIRGKKE